MPAHSCHTLVARTTRTAIHSAGSCHFHSHVSMLTSTPTGGRHSRGFEKKSLHGEHINKAVEIISITVGAMMVHAVETLAMGSTSSHRTYLHLVSCSARVVSMLRLKTHSPAHAVRSSMFAAVWGTFDWKKCPAPAHVDVTHCHGRRRHLRRQGPSFLGRLRN